MLESPPTDLKLLKAIYAMYLQEFLKYSNDDLERKTAIYVPIDVGTIAKKLGTDPQLVFGRLYYDLDKRHRYRQDDGAHVHLFHLDVGGDKHVVNFPLLTGVLANLSEKNFQFWLPLVFSIAAIVMAILGLA